MKTSLLVTLILLAGRTASAAVDLDGNGLSDIFEFLYFAGPADPAADPDGDGFSTFDEMIWGTEPTNARSSPAGATAQIEGDDLLLSWPAVPGKWYRLQSTLDLQIWEMVAEGHIANHSEPLDDSGLRFWRVQILGTTPDSDDDGFDDWEEALWKSKYGDVPGKTDLDGDGLLDAAEFTGGRQPEKKDHPAVRLVVFTPLEK